jgi:uncharacterized protein with von Willebrand factor type A (vWA) domain
MPPAEQAVMSAVVALGRALRSCGVPSCADQELLLCRALAEVDIRRRERVYWAARAAFVRSPAEVPVFDVVFDRFWSGLEPLPAEARSEHGASDPRMQGPQHGGQSLPQFRRDGTSAPLLDGRPNRATREIPSAGTDGDRRHERIEQRGLLAAYSPDEVLSEREEMSFARDELAALRRLADELRDVVPLRTSRRLRPSRRGGRIDMRRTLRRSLATDGELVRHAFRARSSEPRRLLLVCDVSGSMERYSRALLAVLQAAAHSGLKCETFVFATRLTRVTAPLKSRDAERALDEARAAIGDWSGGTRIGDTLAQFNRSYGRRGFARGAIVVIVSDGWDRGDPARLAEQVRRLQLQARRLVWLNPRPGGVDGQPLAVGMRAALPHVDDFVAGHDPRATGQLARVIAGLGPARPARSQRPLGLVAR